MSWGCSYNGRKLGGFKQQDVFSLALEARRLKSGCRPGSAPSKGSRWDARFLFELLGASGVPELVEEYLQALPPSSHGLLLVLFSS